MRYAIDDIESILLDGTEGQIKGLDKLDTIVSFSYTLEHDALKVQLGNDYSSLKGIGYTPNCVRLYGYKYTFGRALI